MLGSPPARVLPSQQDRFSLLCDCSTANPTPDQVARISNRSCKSLDWPALFQLAEHHGVLPLVAYNLLHHLPDVPEDISQSLRSAYEANSQRSLWFAGELARLLEHFTKREIRTIPFKGSVLAQSAYGDLGLRSFFDLDFLISPAQFEQAKQALAEIGYHPAQAISAAVERLYLQTGYERSFDGAGGKNLIELQWSLLPYFYAIDSRASGFRIENLFDRASRVRLGEAEVPCLSPEDSLIALCLHAAKHLWTRLIWVADIAQTLSLPQLDFSAIASRAQSLGIMRILGVSCRLAEKLLGAALPGTANDLPVHDAEVLKIAEEREARLAGSATYDFDSAGYFLQLWKLRERQRDRCRYLWRLAWTPGPGEIAAVKLPEALFPLYRVVRLGRLLRKLI